MQHHQQATLLVRSNAALPVCIGTALSAYCISASTAVRWQWLVDTPQAVVQPCFDHLRGGANSHFELSGRDEAVA